MKMKKPSSKGKKSDDKHVATPAASKSEDSPNIHEGSVVSMTGDKLTTTCDAGKEHCYTMAKDATVTCDGNAIKAADLTAGSHVRVTTHKDDKATATAVESNKKTQIPAHKA